MAEFECKTCGKSFDSQRALGGHEIHHKNGGKKKRLPSAMEVAQIIENWGSKTAQQWSKDMGISVNAVSKIGYHAQRARKIQGEVEFSPFCPQRNIKSLVNSYLVPKGYVVQ